MSSGTIHSQPQQFQSSSKHGDPKYDKNEKRKWVYIPKNKPIYLANTDGEIKETNVDELLPYSFEGDDMDLWNQDL